jgi:hypothetical protein
MIFDQVSPTPKEDISARGLLSNEGKNCCDAVLNGFEENTIYIHRMQLRLGNCIAGLC